MALMASLKDTSKRRPIDPQKARGRKLVYYDVGFDGETAQRR